MFHRQVALSPADLLIFRLITSLTPFFFGFEVPPTIGLFIPGRWITFAEANAYHLRDAVNFFRDVPALPIHDLPDGSVVLELVSRPVHYQLYGAGLTNQVVSYPEAVGLFQEGDIWNLRAAELRRLGVTHAYAMGIPTLAPGCVRLSLTRNSTATRSTTSRSPNREFSAASSMIVPLLCRTSPRIWVRAFTGAGSDRRLMRCAATSARPR